jgi:hypothetical protein
MPIYYINYLCTYDLYDPVRNAFDAGSIHYLGKWDNIESLGECHLGPKKFEISSAQPPPTCPSKGCMPASKALRMGQHKS